jgi:hypothetical protein
MAEALAQQVAAAVEAAGTNPAAAVARLRDVVTGAHPNDVESLKVKETALQKLTELLVKQQDAAALRGLLTDLRPLFAAIPKAKTAKIVRTVIDSIAKVPNSTQLLVRGDAGAGVGRRGGGSGAVAGAGSAATASRLPPLLRSDQFVQGSSCLRIRGNDACLSSTHLPPPHRLRTYPRRYSCPCTHLPACPPAHLPAAGGVQGAGGVGHL